MIKIIPKYNSLTGEQTVVLKGIRYQDGIEQYQRFTNIYDVELLVFMNNNKKELLPEGERTCRFCGKKYPEVTFENDAHLVPQLIGNKKLLSDFECDNCNSFFGDYENHFVNFLGLPRTLSAKKGQTGIPTYKSPDKNLILNICCSPYY